MKKYITLLLLAFVFISCKTTSLEKTDTLKIELEKAIADINGTVKIEHVSGYKSNIIRADAGKILFSFKEITLMDNGFKTRTDYSIFMENHKVDYGSNLAIKITENDTNRIVYSETVFLSERYFKKNYTLKNHNPIIEAILIAVTAGILITGCLF